MAKDLKALKLRLDRTRRVSGGGPGPARPGPAVGSTAEDGPPAAGEVCGSSGRRWAGIAVLVVAVAAASFFAGRATEPGAATGNKLPELTLEQYNRLLATLKGEPLVVSFWASWCGPCREEAPLFEKYYEKYKGRVNFIGIASDDLRPSAAGFVEEFKLGYPNYFDTTSRIHHSNGVNALPTTLFIGADGKVVQGVTGGLDEELMRKYITAALAKR